MEFPAAEPIARALQDYGARRAFGYVLESYRHDPAARDDVGDLVVDRMYARFRWKISRDDVVYTPGVLAALNVACQIVASESAGIVVQSPIYPPLLRIPRNANLDARTAELRRSADGSYAIDRDDFERALTSTTGAFVLCNPHNPLGRVYRREELEWLAQLCLARGILILSDEIHSDILFDGHQHIPVASLGPEVADSTITFLGPSKTFNLAGLHGAFAIVTNAERRRAYKEALSRLMLSVCAPAIVAAEAAYRHGGPWLEDLLADLDDNRRFLSSYLGRELPGIRMTVPEGTYLAWLDCRALALENPCTFFLEQARIALADGASFGPGGEGFVRMTFAVTRPTLEEGLRRISAVLHDRPRDYERNT